MDGFERRIATLLQDAVPEPDGGVSVREVERLGRRRRVVAVATPIVAVVAVILAVVAGVTIAKRDDKRVQPAQTYSTYRIGGISVDYPSEWHRAVLDTNPAVNGVPGTSMAADDPRTFVVSQKVETVCQPVVPSGQLCLPGVHKLGAADIYVGFNEFVPPNPGSIGPGLMSKLAGRPASVIEDFNVNRACPAGTASTTDAIISISAGRYLSIMGCLGSSPAAAKAFQKLLDSARFTR